MTVIAGNITKAAAVIVSDMGARLPDRCCDCRYPKLYNINISRSGGIDHGIAGCRSFV
jgi:hypothetical protein